MEWVLSVLWEWPIRSPKARFVVKLGLDAVLAVAALAFSGASTAGHWFLPELAIWLIWSVVVAALFGLPRQHYRLLGFRDCCWIVFASIMLLPLSWGTVRLLGAGSLAMRAWLDGCLLTGIFWLGLRGLIRIRVEGQTEKVSHGGSATLIIGAGRGGLMAAKEVELHPELAMKVVGFIDDSLEKQGLRVHGLPVLGSSELIPHLVKELHIRKVILAIPSATGQQMRRFASLLEGGDVQVKTLPGVFNILGNQTWKPELRDISIDDLLRREPTMLDQQGLRETIEDQVILITGAGGSIGSELARQICAFRPGRLLLLGRGENSLWRIERELRQQFPNQPMALELCDIRNLRRLTQVFDRWHPTVVFHAAAHKHVPFLEAHPEEAVENNVFGTRNVLEASIQGQVCHFVNVSTDKAVNPTNVLGVSKRIAELLVAEASHRTPPQSHYVSVRFGNVLGSRGSVVPIFQEQIRMGGPVTITHPEMTRYFMTIPEASRLVLQSGLLGETGRVYALDMGEPIRIMDLAKDLIQLSGLILNEDISINVTGIRPGEKLYEELFYSKDIVPSSVHPKVFEATQLAQPGFDPVSMLKSLEAVLDLPLEDRRLAMLHLFLKAVPTYAPSPSGMGKWLKELTCSC